MRLTSLVCMIAIASAAGPAAADTLAVGLFAPGAPFPSTAARVQLATRLGEHLGVALGGTGKGRVYARAGDFAAAVRTGDVKIALVDAGYLATTNTSYTVLGAAVRTGSTSQGWQLIARGPTKLQELRGKRVLVPSIGGRETDLVINVFLGGEVARDFFSKIEPAPDTASALAALGLGKTDAIIVPTGVELPSGTSSVLRLPALSGPLLVAYGTLPDAQRAALASAAKSFRGDQTVTGFSDGNAEDARAITRRFTLGIRRGPLAVPAARLVVGDLVEGRALVIERAPATSFATTPPPR